MRPNTRRNQGHWEQPAVTRVRSPGKREGEYEDFEI